jgi:hypothetical protein
MAGTNRRHRGHRPERRRYGAWLAGPLLAAALLQGCDGGPDAAALTAALEEQIRADVRAFAPVLRDAQGMPRPIEPSLVDVRDLVIDDALFVTDYWSIAATFTLDYGHGEQEQTVRVRAVERPDGTWEIREIVRRNPQR